MSSQVLSGSQLHDFLPPAEADFFSASVWNAPTRTVSAVEANELAESASEDRTCLRGAGIALGLEACALLFIYGAWQLWQAFR